MHFKGNEYAGRRSRLRQAMERESLDGMLLFAQESMYWLTGYDTFGFCFFQCLVVPLEGEPILLTRAPDLRQAQHTSNLPGYPDLEGRGGCEPGRGSSCPSDGAGTRRMPPRDRTGHARADGGGGPGCPVHAGWCCRSRGCLAAGTAASLAEEPGGSRLRMESGHSLRPRTGDGAPAHSPGRLGGGDSRRHAGSGSRCRWRLPGKPVHHRVGCGKLAVPGTTRAVAVWMPAIS